MSPAKAKRKSSTSAPRSKGGGRTCAVPDCGRRVASDGLCEIHLPFLESRGELGRRMKRWLAAAGVTPSDKSTEAPEKGTSQRKPAGRGGKTKAGGARAPRKTTPRKSPGKGARDTTSADDQPAEQARQDEPSTQAFQADDQENTPIPTSDMDAAPEEPAFREEPPQEEPPQEEPPQEETTAEEVQEDVPADDADQEAEASEPNHALGAEEPAGEPAVSTASPSLGDQEEDAGEPDQEEQDEDEDDDQDGATLDDQSDNDDEEEPTPT